MIFFDFTISQKIRRMMAMAVIAALVLRALIPVGYMPDATPAHQPLGMVMCGGMGPMEMPGKKAGDHNLQDRAPCPFSLNAVFAFGAVEPELVPLLISFVIISLFSEFVFVQARRFGNGAPRAPPLFS